MVLNSVGVSFNGTNSPFSNFPQVQYEQSPITIPADIGDTVEISGSSNKDIDAPSEQEVKGKKGKTDKKEVDPNVITRKNRNIFGQWKLTPEQVALYNEKGEVPKGLIFDKNLKMVKEGKFKTGTHTIPAGYELKNNRFGHTKLVLKDTQGFFFKENKVEA